jgi:hypothetical protein
LRDTLFASVDLVALGVELEKELLVGGRLELRKDCAAAKMESTTQAASRMTEVSARDFLIIGQLR